MCSHARSLWRLEPLRIACVASFDSMHITIIHFQLLSVSNFHLSVPVGRWSGGHIKWGQSFRIRHITTGRYLCLDEEKGLLLVDAEKANSKMSAFCFRISKVICHAKSNICLRPDSVAFPKLVIMIDVLLIENTGEN